MAAVRIFLLTCRRPALLPRALASLRAQTFTDWVCELHNDAPEDDFPRQLVEQTADPRITLHQHDCNWGAVASFNHAFGGGPEPYASMLEDDNWWDPGFLVAALRVIESHPAASLVWANMRLWQEQAGGGWSDTGRTIWPQPPVAPASRSFRWPVALQAFDGLHSNGAMIFRPGTFRTTTVPAGTPFAIIEPVRERAANGELVLLSEPLANFAVSLQSARGSDRELWLQSQLLLAVSFFATVPLDATTLAEIWAARRIMTPRGTNLLFLVALALRRPGVLKPAQAGDWLRFGLNFARHPVSNLRGLRFREDHGAVWAWLQRHTLPEPLPSGSPVLAKHPCPPPAA